MRVRADRQTNQQDITDIFFDLQEKYKEVFLFQYDNLVFIYKALGRKDYKKICESDVNSFAKEEVVCSVCTLYPEGFDFENCDAGLPSKYAEHIIKNSFLDSLESRQKVIDYFRNQMYMLDNQVSCLIHEVFPEYSIEEIEEWNVQRTAEMHAKAEWILVNVRGLQFNADPFTGQTLEELEASEKEQKVETKELGADIKASDEKVEFKSGETLEERQARIGASKNGKNKMTPEKLAELKAKYPEMDWGSNVYEDLTDSSAKSDVCITTNPALIPT